MKPNDKAYEAARSAILKAIAERNCIIAGVPFNENNTDDFEAGEAVEHAKVAVDAAFAAQFPPSEDYAGLVARLRQRGGWTSDKVWESEPDCHEAADALEALRAERDALKAELAAANKRAANRLAVEAERDALLARLAPVEDEALVEIAAKEFIEATTDIPPRTTYTISERSLGGARAAIAAIRPHIEAAEREKCAKIAEEGEDGSCWTASERSIAAAIRSGE